MQTELAQVSGIPLGPIRLIGVEIVFGSDAAGNSRGRVWLPLQALNHLIYGKNGVGKSTVVNLIRCALTGEEPLDDARVDLFIELDESVPFPIRREESIEAVIPLDFDGGDSSQSQLLIDPDDEKPVDETDSAESQEDSEHDLDSAINQMVGKFYKDGYFFLDTDKLVKAISVCWFFQQLCPAIGMEFEAFDAIQQLIVKDDEGIDMQQFVSRSWDDQSGVSLRQARIETPSSCFV